VIARRAAGLVLCLQLVNQVEDALRLGYLTLGDPLPKVWDVVAALAINPNTADHRRRGLDEDGNVALFASALRDFYELRSGTGERRAARSGEAEGVA
jgi:hypothetical protein